MAYTTSANIAARLGKSLTADQSTYFTSVLDAAIDAYINKITGTSFGSTVSVEVYVETDDTQGGTLVIPTMHDITSLAKVNNDGTEELIPVDDYYTWPRGVDDKLAIKSVSGDWESDATYKITGELGYKNIPADIVEVATELAVNGLSGNVNDYKSEKVGDWSVTYAEGEKQLSSSAMTVLNSYNRLSRSV